MGVEFKVPALDRGVLTFWSPSGTVRESLSLGKVLGMEKRLWKYAFLWRAPVPGWTVWLLANSRLATPLTQVKEGDVVFLMHLSKCEILR